LIRKYGCETVLQDIERQLDAAVLKRHWQRIKRAQQAKSSIPGPKEAKECMLAIEKQHMHARKARLKACRPSNHTLVITLVFCRHLQRNTFIHWRWPARRFNRSLKLATIK